jgi:polysaccharide biosynthesis protein PslG
VLNVKLTVRIAAVLLPTAMLGTLNTVGAVASTRPFGWPLGVVAAARPFGGPPLGVATVATMIPGSDMQREVSAVAATGANAIRIPVSWNLAQPSSSGPLQLQQVDGIVAAANRSGLKILLNLVGPAPVWAQRLGANPTLNGNGPASPTVFGSFAEAVARRYAGLVSMWEVWNEPNISHYLIPPTANAYLPILRAGYLGIRRSGSAAPVLSAGTSSFAGAQIPANEAGAGMTSDIEFITSLYQAGGARYFDGVAVHPYSFPNPVQFDNGPGAIVSQVRQLMVEHGDANKKVWITEFGQPTGTTSVSTNEQQQAAILIDAINKSRQVPWIGGFFVFNTVDLAPNSTDPDYNFGLYHFDFTPKQIVGALQAPGAIQGGGKINR